MRPGSCRRPSSGTPRRYPAGSTARVMEAAMVSAPRVQHARREPLSEVGRGCARDADGRIPSSPPPNRRHPTGGGHLTRVTGRAPAGTCRWEIRARRCRPGSAENRRSGTLAQIRCVHSVASLLPSPFGFLASAGRASVDTGVSASASTSSMVDTRCTVISARSSAVRSSLTFLAFCFGTITSRMPTRRAASTFSLRPPMGSTRPDSVISPVIAISPRTDRPVSTDAIAATIVTPADGPSFREWRQTARARASRRS